MIRLRIEGASAKINNGGASDNATVSFLTSRFLNLADSDRRIWRMRTSKLALGLESCEPSPRSENAHTNLLRSPLRTIALDPIPSEYNVLAGAEVPEHVRSFKESWEDKMKTGFPAVEKA